MVYWPKADSKNLDHTSNSASHVYCIRNGNTTEQIANEIFWPHINEVLVDKNCSKQRMTNSRKCVVSVRV